MTMSEIQLVTSERKESSSMSTSGLQNSTVIATEMGHQDVVRWTRSSTRLGCVASSGRGCMVHCETRAVSGRVVIAAGWVT